MKRDFSSLPAYVDNLQTEGQYTFSRKKVIKELALSDNAFKLAANRLVKKGRVRRIRSDFYVIVPLEYREMGCLPASWFIDSFMRFLKADYYVSILSAAALHGASHQQAMVFQVIANQILKPIRVGRLRLDFHYKKLIDFSFSEPVKTETGTMEVATPEMAACDIVRYIDAAGQIHNVTTVLCELEGQINMDRLMNYVNRGYIEVSVVQRLGYLLDFLQTKLSLNKLSNWVKTKQPHYRLLVAGNPTPIIERNKRWRVLVNEQVEIDV